MDEHIYKTEDSIIGYNVEDVTDSDLEIESLMRELDSVIEEFCGERVLC